MLTKIQTLVICCVVWLGAAIGNFLWQVFTEQRWMIALDHSYRQLWLLFMIVVFIAFFPSQRTPR